MAVVVIGFFPIGSIKETVLPHFHEIPTISGETVETGAPVAGGEIVARVDRPGALEGKPQGDLLLVIDDGNRERYDSRLAFRVAHPENELDRIRVGEHRPGKGDSDPRDIFPGRQIRSGVLLALRLPVDLGEIVFLGHCVGPLDPLHALQVPSGVYLTPNGFLSACKDGFDFLDSEGFAFLRLDDQLEQPGELVGIGVGDRGRAMPGPARCPRRRRRPPRAPSGF